MNLKINSIVDVIVDRSPEELIAGVLIALVLAFAVSGLFLLLRRKVSDVSTLIISLAIVSNLMAMIMSGAYIREGILSGRRSASNSNSPGPGMNRHRFDFRSPRDHRGMFVASRILKEADLDADGMLTADEAAMAAAQFVKGIEESKEDGDGQSEEGLSEAELGKAIRTRLMPSSSEWPEGLGRPPFPSYDPKETSGDPQQRISKDDEPALSPPTSAGPRTPDVRSPAPGSDAKPS